MIRSICLAVICCSAPTLAEDGGVSTDRGAYKLTEGVVYAEKGGRELKVDIYASKKDGLKPAVLIVHGGAWKSGNRKQLKRYADPLARRGYVTFAIDYRLAPTHKFPAQIEDCRSAVQFIRKNAEKFGVDPERVGAAGYSAGGHLVCLLGVTGEKDAKGGDTRVQAVAAGGAPTEFRFMPDGGEGLSFWLGDPEENKENFKNASATAFASADDAPTFFFNGDADRVVPLLWTQPLVSSLKAVGVEAELHKVEGAGHMRAAGDAEALSEAWDFLDKHLHPVKD